MTIRKQTRYFRKACALLAVWFSLSGTPINESLAEDRLRYPVKIFPSEQVPVPSGILPTDIAWIDNDTLIYKLLPPEGDTATETRIVRLNLDTLERQDIDTATHHGVFCYDTLSKNIAYSTSIQKHDPKWWTIQYKWGVLGQELQHTQIEHTQANFGQLFINPFDCSFSYPYKWDDPSKMVDNVPMRALPQNDGRIGRVQRKGSSAHAYGTLLHEDNAGNVKVVPSDEGGYFLPSLDLSSRQYWHYAFNRADRTVTVWRYDRQFNLVSQKTYPPGPWPTGTTLHAVKQGYLIYRSVMGGAGKFFLLKFDGEVTEVFSDFGTRGGVSVSPDGCKAIFLHQDEPGCCRIPQMLASVNLC